MISIKIVACINKSCSILAINPLGFNIPVALQLDKAHAIIANNAILHALNLLKIISVQLDIVCNIASNK